MKTEIKIAVRAYQVLIKDERTGEKINDTIVLEKARLQAGAMVGLSDKELIYHIYNRQGFRVIDVCNVHKATITVDLSKEYNELIAQEYLEMEEQMGPAEQEAKACANE